MTESMDQDQGLSRGLKTAMWHFSSSLTDKLPVVANEEDNPDGGGDMSILRRAWGVVSTQCREFASNQIKWRWKKSMSIGAIEQP